MSQVRAFQKGSCAKRYYCSASSTPAGVSVQGIRPTTPKAWEIASTTLKNRYRLKFASLAEANTKKATIIDIRPVGDYNKGHIPDALSVEYYRLIQGWDAQSIARRVGFLLFGVTGTEGNPTFVDEVEKVSGGRNKAVILVCNIGGSLEAYGPSEFGQQSRSLLAAFTLFEEGFKDVRVLKGGFSEWCRQDYEIETLA